MIFDKTILSLINDNVYTLKFRVMAQRVFSNNGRSANLYIHYL